MNKTQCIGLYPRKPRLHYLVFQNIEHPQPPTPHTHTHADIHIWKIFEEINFVTFSNFKKYIEKGV